MFTPDLMTLAEAVVARAQARGMTLATAESCTGGLVAALIGGSYFMWRLRRM